MSSDAGKIVVDSIRYVNYETLRSRRQSFQHELWMIAKQQKILNSMELAYFGFFYSGYADIVICYCCGLMLYDWKKESEYDHLKEITNDDRQKNEQIYANATNAKLSMCAASSTTVAKKDFKNYINVVNEHRFHNAECVNIKRFFHMFKQEDVNVLRSQGILFESSPEELLKWLPSFVRKHVEDLNKTRCALNAFVKKFNSFKNELLVYISKKENIIENLSYRILIDRLDISTNILTRVERRRINDELTSSFQLLRTIVRPLKYFGTSYDENNSLRENVNGCDACCICLEKKPIVLFLPCLHLMCCRECSTKIIICPICREDIYVCFSVIS